MKLVIDKELVNSWLAEDGHELNDEQADKLIDYIWEDVMDRAYELVKDGHDDLFGGE